jgi:hypothetical protein
LNYSSNSTSQESPRKLVAAWVNRARGCPLGFCADGSGRKKKNLVQFVVAFEPVCYTGSCDLMTSRHSFRIFRLLCRGSFFKLNPSQLPPSFANPTHPLICHSCRSKPPPTPLKCTPNSHIDEENFYSDSITVQPYSFPRRWSWSRYTAVGLIRTSPCRIRTPRARLWTGFARALGRRFRIQRLLQWNVSNVGIGIMSSAHGICPGPAPNTFKVLGGSATFVKSKEQLFQFIYIQCGPATFVQSKIN